jgi:predicted O-methyltransferase YrrM
VTPGSFDNWHPEIEGWSSDILPWYYRMAGELPQGARIAEVGVWHGRSILFLAERLLELGNIADLIGIDINLTKAVENQSKIKGISINWMQNNSLEVSKEFANRSFDLVFIDALHDYDSVKGDIIAWMHKVLRGGILAGHDYMHAGEHAGVGRAVDEVFKPLSPVTVEGTVWWTRIP